MRKIDLVPKIYPGLDHDQEQFKLESFVMVAMSRMQVNPTIWMPCVGMNVSARTFINVHVCVCVCV
jgi:hypothetical protein